MGTVVLIIVSCIVIFISLCIIGKVSDINFNIYENNLNKNNYNFKKSKFLKTISFLIILCLVCNLFLSSTYNSILNFKLEDYKITNIVQYNFCIDEESPQTPKFLLNENYEPSTRENYYNILVNIDGIKTQLKLQAHRCKIIYNEEVTKPYLQIVYFEKNEKDSIFYETKIEYHIYFPFTYQFEEGGEY